VLANPDYISFSFRCQHQEAIEGPMVPTACLFGVPLCDGSACILGKVMVEANDLLHDRLSNTSLDEVGEFFDGEGLGDSG